MGLCDCSGRGLPSMLLLAALLQLHPPFTSAFLAPNLGPGARNRSTLIGKFSGSDETDDDDDHDNGEEPEIKPYRNRSLAWTLRYRQVNPYERVRARVIGFGHRSKEDWDEAVSSGQLGQYVPSYPDEMYAPEWVSWEEWLGVMRSYGEAKNLANVLGLKSLDDYLLFVKSNSKRAEGLRIPVRPDIYYKDEWIDEESFFGK